MVWDTFNLPKGAIARHADMKDNSLNLWVEVDNDPEAPKEERRFIFIGTGGPVPDNSCFISTVMNPPYVWHVYETAATDGAKRLFLAPEQAEVYTAPVGTEPAAFDTAVNLPYMIVPVIIRTPASETDTGDDRAAR